jgi:hypothetical protein
MFRTLGLRHLPVVDEEYRLCGLLTRECFMESYKPLRTKVTRSLLFSNYLVVGSNPPVEEIKEDEEDMVNGDDDDDVALLDDGHVDSQHSGSRVI